MPKSIIGLDIGTSAVRGAEVMLGKARPVLTRFGQLEVPAGAMRDGEVVDPAAVGDSLARLWKQVGFKGKRNIVLGISNQKVIVRQVDLPWMAEEDLRAALEFQVQEFIPIPIEEAILDFLILDEYQGPEGERMMRVLIVAAQRDMIDQMIAALEYAKLTPTTIDLAPFALLRSLVSTYGLDQPVPAEAIVDVGAGVTNIVVHEDGRPRFVRILIIGGNNFTEALSVGLTLDPASAEQLKRQVSIPGAPPVPGAEQAIQIINDRTAAFVDEIRGSLDFYMAQPEAATVGRVLLSGGGSRLPDLAQRLSDALGIPVDYGHPLQYVELANLGMPTEALAEAQPLMAVAVGLTMGAV